MSGKEPLVQLAKDGLEVCLVTTGGCVLYHISPSDFAAVMTGLYYGAMFLVVLFRFIVRKEWRKTPDSSEKQPPPPSP